MCYSAAPSTTNQNATQRTYIKDIKWLGKSLQAYSIKMQYEIVIKGDRWCSCYTCLPQTTPATTQTGLKMAAPSTGTGAPPVAQRLLTFATPKRVHNHIHTCRQEKTLRNSTTIHKNSTLNQSKTILHITTIAWV